MSSNGYVYVLSNESMPGIVKIGKTTRGGKHRVKELWTTGVPTPFKLEFEIYMEDCAALEAEVHDYFSNKRISGNREFFRVDTFEAISGVITVSASWFDLHCGHYDSVVEPSAIAIYANSMDEPVPIITGALRYITDDELKVIVERYKKQIKQRASELRIISANELMEAESE